MNAIGIGMLLFIAYFGFRGFQRGLIEEVGRLIGLVLALVLAGRLAPILGAQLGFESPTARTAAAFVLIFVGILVAVSFLTKAVRTLVELVLLGWLDRLGGTVFGVLKSILVLGIILYLFQSFDVTRKITERMHDQSAFYRQIVSVRDGLFKVLTLDKLLDEAQDKLKKVDPKDLMRPLIKQT